MGKEEGVTKRKERRGGWSNEERATKKERQRGRHEEKKKTRKMRKQLEDTSLTTLFLSIKA